MKILKVEIIEGDVINTSNCPPGTVVDVSLRENKMYVVKEIYPPKVNKLMLRLDEIKHKAINYEPVLCADCVYAGALSFTSYSKKCCHPEFKDKLIINKRTYSCNLGER